jgi:hypothetical protein
MSCRNAVAHPQPPPGYGRGRNRSFSRPDYAWTDLTYLLHKRGVSWSYYVQSGIQPDCDDNPDETAAGCAPVAQGAKTRRSGTPSQASPT